MIGFAARLLVFALALLGSLGQVRADVVDTKVNPSNGHTYYLLSPNTWTASEAEAVSLGGHLATVRNAEEDLWIWNNFGSVSGNHILYYLWIGLNDVGSDGNFVWSSGEPVTYTNWVINQPSGDNGPPYQPGDGKDYYLEDYVQMGYEGVNPIYGWNDLVDVAYFGSTPLYGVAEVPEPSTFVLLGMGAVGLLGFAWRRRRTA